MTSLDLSSEPNLKFTFYLNMMTKMNKVPFAIITVTFEFISASYLGLAPSVSSLALDKYTPF